MQFALIVKAGLTELANVKGREVYSVYAKDEDKVIEVEQLLERLLGFRVHITQVK